MDELIVKIRKFVEERDWSKYHNPKDLAIAISIEANELLELFLWKSPEEAEVEKLKQEIADVMIYCLMLSDKLNIDIIEAIDTKIEHNSSKYPPDKFKSNYRKYNE